MARNRCVSCKSVIFCTKKGQDLLIRAVGALVYDRSMPVYADFIGEGNSNSYLTDLVAELKLESHCRFLGTMAREAVYELLPEYDVLVQPSREEGFGLTIIEAMIAGVPVLVSDIEGPMEVIAQGRYGFHFHINDYLDLADRLIYIKNQSAESDFSKFCDVARIYAQQNFDVRQTAINYIDEYRKITE